MCIFTGDELIADDDDKQQQLLNYMIQVCRPKDWQISLLEDRLTKKQLVQAQHLSDEMLIVKYEDEHQQKELKRLQQKGKTHYTNTHIIQCTHVHDVLLQLVKM